MPICGYVVYPVAGKSNELRRTLESIAGCEVRPAENTEALLLVTDTVGEAHEDRLQKKLKGIQSIQCLAMTFGAMDGAEAPVSGGCVHIESPQEEGKS